jgi:hypothetical protein
VLPSARPGRSDPQPERLGWWPPTPPRQTPRPIALLRSGRFRSARLSHRIVFGLPGFDEVGLPGFTTSTVRAHIRVKADRMHPVPGDELLRPLEFNLRQHRCGQGNRISDQGQQVGEVALVPAGPLELAT